MLCGGPPGGPGRGQAGRCPGKGGVCVRKVRRLLFNRITITGALILIQLAWLLAAFTELAYLSPWIGAGLSAMSLLVVLYIVRKDDNPAYKIGWIILILLIPLLGALLYLCFGNKRPARGMRRRFRRAQALTRPVLGQNPAAAAGLAGRPLATARYVARYGPWPVWRNTDVTYYPVGEAMFADMMAALESARHYIFLEYFIVHQGSYMWESMLAVLKRKAAQGVEVRMMYDDLGSVAILPGDYWLQMEQAGIKCMAFNPFVPVMSLVMNNRDHRKILVVDGHTAFNGGINLADEYINRTHPHGHWKDTGLRLVGEGVWNFTVMFLETWNAFRPTETDLAAFRPAAHHPAPFTGTGYVQPFGDTPLDDEPLSENVYNEILAQALDYVYICTPYLSISNEMQAALCTAAKRGVDVRIITPGIPDKKIVYRLTRSYYPPLLQAGVKIFEYTPGFIHAKSYVSDDRLAVVGTINMDFRSLYLHFECGTLLYGCRAVADVKADFLETQAKCRTVRLSDCRTGFFGGLWNAVLRVLAPLL